MDHRLLNVYRQILDYFADKSQDSRADTQRQRIMTSVSVGQIILTSTKPVGSGRPDRTHDLLSTTVRSTDLATVLTERVREKEREAAERKRYMQTERLRGRVRETE